MAQSCHNSKGENKNTKKSRIHRIQRAKNKTKQNKTKNHFGKEKDPFYLPNTIRENNPSKLELKVHI
jgi:hypothetical protein